MMPDTVTRKALRRVALTEAESATLLAGYGIGFSPWRTAADAREAVQAAEAIGFPVVVKATVPGLAHKSDLGGVELDLRTPDEVEGAAERIRARLAPSLEGVAPGFLVQRMVKGGLEMIVGAARDAQFGPVVMLGLGGIYAEVFEDVAFMLAPVSERSASRALESLRSAVLLRGARGQDRRDMEALVSVARSLGRVLADRPDIQSVEVNPLMVLSEGQGCLAVDALVEVAAPEDR